MSLTDSLLELAGRLPEAALPHAVKLVADALASDDPADYLARRAQADVAHAATRKAVEQILGE